MTRRPLMLHPTAFLPVAMSLAALTAVLLHLARSGPAPQPDEGAAAHVWQILMAAQVPIIGLFAVKRFPDTPRSAALVLGLQLAAACAAALPVFLLGW